MRSNVVAFMAMALTVATPTFAAAAATKAAAPTNPAAALSLTSLSGVRAPSKAGKKSNEVIAPLAALVGGGLLGSIVSITVLAAVVVATAEVAGVNVVSNDSPASP